MYRYNPATRETHLLATGFFYSNGIALSADGSYLVISETDRLRLVKYYLHGPKVCVEWWCVAWCGMCVCI